MNLNGNNQQWRQYAAQLTREENSAKRAAPLRLGKPAEDARGRRRIGAGFARAKQKPDDYERPQTRHPAGKRRKRGPPQNDPGEHRARAEPIAEKSTWDFEKCVGDRECAGNVAPVLRTEVKFCLDPWPGDRNADAIEICED